jgi:hypothetical protein
LLIAGSVSSCLQKNIMEPNKYLFTNTEAQGAGFALRTGQSHVTNDNFITDAEMVARYGCQRVQDYSEMAVWRNYEAIPVIPTLVFDLLDPAANTNTLLTNTANNVVLTATGDPKATWLTNYEGFARVLNAPNPAFI